MRFIIFFLICFQIVFGKPTKRTHIHGEENGRFVCRSVKNYTSKQHNTKTLHNVILRFLNNQL